MNLKYIGEAIALLGIAYSIMRWVARNIAESDPRSNPTVEVRLGDVARQDASRIPRRVSRAAGIHDAPGEHETPAAPADPRMLDAAAVLFGISRDALERMDPRERALLLSGYRAAKRAAATNGE